MIYIIFRHSRRSRSQTPFGNAFLDALRRRTIFYKNVAEIQCHLMNTGITHRLN
jgi:hypothetical protein